MIQPDAIPRIHTMTACNTLEWSGDRWTVRGTGRCAEGQVLCHLASTTRKVGRHPVQVSVEIDADLLEKAQGRPRGFYTWNRSLRGAFLRGQRDRAAGLTLADCPYPDGRKADGRLTWSRGYRTAWKDGFQWEAPRRESSDG